MQRGPPIQQQLGDWRGRPPIHYDAHPYDRPPPQPFFDERTYPAPPDNFRPPEPRQFYGNMPRPPDRWPEPGRPYGDAYGPPPSGHSSSSPEHYRYMSEGANRPPPPPRRSDPYEDRRDHRPSGDGHMDDSDRGRDQAWQASRWGGERPGPAKRAKVESECVLLPI